MLTTMVMSPVQLGLVVQRQERGKLLLQPTPVSPWGILDTDFTFFT